MLIDELQLAPGSMRDYAALAEHHYRAARPATATRVFILRHPRPTVVDRFLQRANPARVVAVLVESMPALNCRLRDYALDNRYGFWKDCRQRAAILNAELRCISRVIVHPQWRGLGLAGKLVRAALDSAPTRYTEALAAMGNVHPFFERAGMIAYRRPAHEFDQRLATALQTAGFEPVDLALLDHTATRIEALPAAKRTWLLREIDRWYRRTFGRSSKAPPDLRRQLRAARQRLSCEPVYYLHVKK
jgi:GNAT superfamily N-acetyltransferase